MSFRNLFASVLTRKKTILGACFILFSAFHSFGQESTLQLDKIMAGNEFIGHQPSDFIWAPNSEDIYFRWNKSNDIIAPYYTYSIKDQTPKQLDINQGPFPLNGFQQYKNNQTTYYQFGESIYKTTKSNSTPIFTSTENYQLFSVRKEHLIIKKNDNLFAFGTTTGTYIQLTNFVTGDASVKKKEQTYLEVQQEELFETIREKKARKSAQKDFNNSLSPKKNRRFYTEGQSIENLCLSENMDRIAFIKSDYPANKSTEYMSYINSDGYAVSKSARAKVGSKNPSHELYLWHLKTDNFVAIDFAQLSGLHKAPDYYSNYPKRDTADYEKEIIFHLHDFNSNGTKCLVEIKSYDNKDRWIGYIDTETNRFIELEHQHDEKWIGGPGISGWNMVAGNIGWIDNEQFYYQSETTGYSHLYILNTSNKSKKALTKGEYEIHRAELSKDKKHFYISANKTQPGNRDFYKLTIENGELQPILTQDGNHEVIISPNEKWLLIKYSFKNKPWELYWAENKKNTTLNPITHSTTPEFESYDWRSPEIIKFIANDSQAVHARIYEPTESTKNGAAVFFVHGAGYLQNAHNWWSGYYREYMFNNMLCDMGYTVMDIDYRASKGYGRDFRTAIYRHMGSKDLSDYVDARDHLVQQYGIDSNRVGIYGGSYGGFISIMALLTEPGKFKCGAAVRSVTDWAHYNHAYTSNILNTPEDDPIAFERSSPIYFAKNLDDHLLMLHGMVDNNVQYQDVVRLSQRFIEEGRKDWDLIGYPIEPHGFKETASWIDEYGRILNLFQEELLLNN